MGRVELGFQYPWMLAFLVLIPITWWIGMRSLSGLGPWRRGIALTLRTLVLLLVIAALAGVQWIWSSDKVTVIYLLDQSDSIPIAKRQLMLEYAMKSVKEHRNQGRKDRAGLIVFGREASIEIPPMDEMFPPISQTESNFGKSDGTNLEAALKLAQASFLEDSARRVVILTDGNQTLGSAEATAQRLRESGIGIDTVPVRLDTTSEVLVEKIDIPGFVRQGQTVDARVVINRYCEPGQERDIPGKLIVKRRLGNRMDILMEGRYTLDRDVNVIPISHKIEETAGFMYEAEFLPDDPLENDTIAQNNRATAFTYARGRGRVMLIEDASNPGNYTPMVEALRRSDIEVDVVDSNSLFTSLIELQSYDSVILAGVPRTTGDDATQVLAFTDDQIGMLVQSAQQFGMGILMLGGPEAFGAGGWTNTKLEEAMPVNFAIKNSKVEAVGALAMVMHASEIAEGNYWQKVIGRSALEALGPQDYCGVVQYDMSGDKWLWGDKTGMAKVGENKSMMRSRMSRMTPGDMPNFDSSLQMALRSLRVVPASVKHMIVISDGDPNAASQNVLNGFVNQKIKISTVAVGAHGPAGHAELKRIAAVTGGSYYVVTNPNALPKIFMREARRVARPLVFEPEGGINPQIKVAHEVLSGIKGPLPKISGFVLTERKDSPLVEVPLLSPRPEEPATATIWATWTYGLGRTAVFTSDAGKRWATEWVDSPIYDQFFSQLVRWTMRPTENDAKINVATNVKEGRVQVVVTALDAEDQYMNYLEMNTSVVGPDLKPMAVTMRQVAPGRYVGEFTPEGTGSYMLRVLPGSGKSPVVTGVTVPFSDEYRVRQANLRLLEQLAGQKPKGGLSGVFGPALERSAMNQLLETNSYRGGLPPAKSLQDVWATAVLIGASLFFADVFIRRVALDWGLPLRMLAARLKGRKSSVQDRERQATLDRLRSRKSTVSDDIDRQRASTQFEPDAESLETSSASGNAAASFGIASSDAPARDPRTPEKPKLEAEQEQSYTSRLLDAKRKAKKNQ